MAREIEGTLGELVTPAVVLETTDSLSAAEAKVQLPDGSVAEEIEAPQGYGVCFRPPKGARGILLAPMGSTEHRVMVAAEHGQYRPVHTCAEGEGGLYGVQSWVVFVGADNVLHIGGGAGRFNGVNHDLTPAPPDVPAGDGTVLDADPALADDAKSTPAMKLYPDGVVEVLRKDGGVTMRVEPDGTIRLGSGTASDPLVLLSKLADELATLRDLYDKHTHTPDNPTSPLTGYSGFLVTGQTNAPTAADRLGGGWPGAMGAAKVVSE